MEAKMYIFFDRSNAHLISQNPWYSARLLCTRVMTRIKVLLIYLSALPLLIYCRLDCGLHGFHECFGEETGFSLFRFPPPKFHLISSGQHPSKICHGEVLSEHYWFPLTLRAEGTHILMYTLREGNWMSPRGIRGKCHSLLFRRQFLPDYFGPLLVCLWYDIENLFAQLKKIEPLRVKFKILP